MALITKTCTKCLVNKDGNQFYKHPRGKFGLRSTCKDCDKSYQIMNKDQIAATARIYYQKNKEDRDYYNKNWTKLNKEKVQKIQRKWRQRHKDKINAKKAKRRATIYKQTPEITNQERWGIQALYTIAQILSKSCDEGFHVDHIFPLSKGGLHCLDNLQVLSAEENLQKSDKVVI